MNFGILLILTRADCLANASACSPKESDVAPSFAPLAKGGRRTQPRITRELSAKNAQIGPISHAFQRENALLWEIPGGLCAQSGTFLAAFAQNGVVCAVYPSAECNPSDEPLHESATICADISPVLATL
jgi:hypothetical protein